MSSSVRGPNLGSAKALEPLILFVWRTFAVLTTAGSCVVVAGGLDAVTEVLIGCFERDVRLPLMILSVSIASLWLLTPSFDWARAETSWLVSFFDAVSVLGVLEERERAWENGRRSAP